MENIGAVFFSVHRWFFLPPRGRIDRHFCAIYGKELARSEIRKPDGNAVVFSIRRERFAGLSRLPHF